MTGSADLVLFVAFAGGLGGVCLSLLSVWLFIWLIYIN
jgi:hypothetical protein